MKLRITAKSRLLTSILATISLSSGVATDANAAWVGEFMGQVESQYDDNVRLSPDDEESAVVTNVGAELRLRRVTENSELAAIAGGSYLMYTAYDGADNLENEDIQYADIRGLRQWDRTQVGINGSMRRDVLLRTVGSIVDPLQTPTPSSGGGGATQDQTGTGDHTTTHGGQSGPSTPIADVAASDVDSGSVQQQVRRVRTRVAPYLNYQVSETTGVQLGYSFLSLDYDDESTTGLQDSKTNSVNVDLWNQRSARDSLRLGARAARFDPNDDPESTDAYEVSVGWTRQFSNNVRAGIDVGGQRSERDNESYSGYLARLNVTRRAESGAIRVNYEHSLQPSGYGDLVESDTVDIGYRVAVSDRLALTVDGRGYRTRQSKDQASNENNDRDYLQVGPGLTYSLTDLIDVGAFYRYRWVDRKNEGSASSNAVGITLSYQPRKRI